MTTSVFATDLFLTRTSDAGKWTHGTLTVAGITVETIENTNTLIPVGTHKVILSYSPRFKKITPEILVDGREGIRIHSVKGTKFALEGCVGVSPENYAKIMEKLEKHNTITISAS